MSSKFTKRLVIDDQQWGIADEDAQTVAEAVQEAIASGSRISLALYDRGSSGHAVTVYLNPAAASSVEVDLLRGPRPSEMS